MSVPGYRTTSAKARTVLGTLRPSVSLLVRDRAVTRLLGTISQITQPCDLHPGPTPDTLGAPRILPPSAPLSYCPPPAVTIIPCLTPCLSCAYSRICYRQNHTDTSGFFCSTLQLQSAPSQCCPLCELIPLMCPFHVDGLWNRFHLGVLQVFWYVCISEYIYAFLLDLCNLEPELLSHKSILF